MNGRLQQQPAVERRKSALSERDIKNIVTAVTQSNNFGGMSERDHMKAHEAIDKFMEVQNKKIEQMEKYSTAIRIAVVSSIAISLTSGLSYLIWLGIQNTIKGL